MINLFEKAASVYFSGFFFLFLALGNDESNQNYFGKSLVF
jgi:hypothetical protein